MKKSLLLAVCCVFFTTLSFGQTEQGKIVLSGSTDLSFSSIKRQVKYDGENVEDEVTANQFSFKPSIGYFMLDNLAFNIGLEFESKKQEGMNSSSLMAGPGLQYYFGTSNIKPYVQADIMFGNTSQDFDENEVTMSAFGYGLGAGFAVFLNQHVALDFGFGYAAATHTYDEDSKYKVKSDGVVFMAGISVHL